MTGCFYAPCRRPDAYDLFAGKIITVGKRKVELPKEFSKTSVLNSTRGDVVCLQVGQRRIEIKGKLEVMIQDNRKWNTKTFGMRLNFTPDKGTMNKSKIHFRISSSPLESEPVSMRDAANMGFTDKVAGDGKGGWTDQGPANDLHAMTPGDKCFGNVSFNIINPDDNGGKSAIVVSAMGDKKFPASRNISNVGRRYKFLYFLHAAGWCRDKSAVGKVTVTYEDGSKSTFDVTGKTDVADWWQSSPVENGVVVWTAENPRSYVGLYMSRFPVDYKTIESIELSGTDKVVWMIAGISGSKVDIELPTGLGEYYIMAGDTWKAFKHDLNVEQGSVLDMSFLTEAPAGKYGRVIINKEGRFAFENSPEKAERFYGTNLCYSANYFSKEDCERLAKRLVQYGYNSVRLHHQDGRMVDGSAADSLTINKENLDKLDYLFFCLKKNGIYVTTDIYVSRKLKPDEIGNVLGGRLGNIKELAPINDRVMDNIKAFARLWLNHVNPYTGIAWKDDPALMSISFINENCLYWIWSKSKDVEKIYRAKFTEWVKEKNLDVSTDKERAGALTQFITDMQIKSYEVMKAYVKDELGCKALYSDSNMCGFIAQAIARNHYDYVDNHGYWDHPKFPEASWRLPFSFHNRSVLSEYCKLPAEATSTRIFGKPFTFTEFNYTNPNKYRGEGNPVMGAYAALQVWDAVYRFAFSHKMERAVEVYPASGFDVASDPISLLGERIIALFFRRGDVAEATKDVPYVVTESVPEKIGTLNGRGQGISGDYNKMGLVHKTGFVVLKDGAELSSESLFAVSPEEIGKSAVDGREVLKDGDNLIATAEKDGLLKKDELDTSSGLVRSDTGEITLRALDKLFRVVTPRSECLVVSKDRELSGKVLGISNVTSFCTIFSGAVDGVNLAESKRILLLHLTDIKNTKAKFLDENYSILAKEGELPHLVRRASATVSLKLSGDAVPTVWALDMTGKHIGKIASTFMEGVLNFTAKTDAKFGSTMAYEINR